ncbi:surface antigen-domain-containing protein [Amylostereum chailletii]|nr:surface antigen-domain-containing protein [Amylostereum chailletii]
MDASLLDQPARVAAVHVEGAKHTRRSFLQSIVSPHLIQHDPATFESVLLTTRNIGHYLRETDVFQSVAAKLEPSSAPGAKPGDVDIIFTTRERGRFFLKTSTEVGNNEGNASATGRIRNVFGGAETLEANISVGTQTRRSFHGTFSAPLTSTLDTRGDISVYASDKDNTTFASCTEALRGARAVVRRGTQRSGQHELGYEAVLRHISGLSESASLSIREAAGQSVKSSIFHSWARDTRNGTITSTEGGLTKIRHEFAGLGGDAAFYKVEAEGQACRQLFPGVFLSVGMRGGLLHNLSGPSLFSDRFQLGGPNNVRSFRTNSMGPRDGPDAVGGDLYWAMGASLITNIPRKPHWPLKTHFYLNAGQLDSMRRSKSLQENIAESLSRPSVSAGLGLIYSFDPIRVELNFGVPLAARKSDGFRRGLQVGMGLEFL